MAFCDVAEKLFAKLKYNLKLNALFLPCTHHSTITNTSYFSLSASLSPRDERERESKRARVMAARMSKSEKEQTHNEHEEEEEMYC